MRRGKWPLLVIVALVLFVLIPVAIGYGPSSVSRQELSDSLSGVISASEVSDSCDAVRADIADSIAAMNDVYVHAYIDGGTGNQALAASSFVVVAFDAEMQDLGNDFNTTNNEFVAPDSGIYDINVRCDIEDNGGANQTGYGQLAVYKNSALMFTGTMIAGYLGGDITAANRGPSLSVNVECAAGDTIRIRAWQSFDSGGGLIIADSTLTWLTIRKTS